VQMEGELACTYNMLTELTEFIIAVEVRILQTYVLPNMRLSGRENENKVDTDKWKPMIMCFEHMYELGEEKLLHSRLADIEEEK
jgi:hypothetical protein